MRQHNQGNLILQTRPKTQRRWGSSQGYSWWEAWQNFCMCLEGAHSGRFVQQGSPSLSLFKNLFIYFNWRLITLQYCGGFCHTFTWISHGCTCVSHPVPLSHLPPHPIPQGCASAPDLSALFHASNLDWSSISHMVMYMFQCYSLIYPTLAFSLRVQKSVLYICVSFAVLHMGSSLQSF